MLTHDIMGPGFFMFFSSPDDPAAVDAKPSGGALVMGGYRLAYRKALLQQAKEEDEFLIEAITAIIRLL